MKRLIILSAFVWAACGGSDKPAAPAASQDQSTGSGDAAIATGQSLVGTTQGPGVATIYAARVDKLNLREEPSKNGKVVAQIPEGGFMEFAGTVSANKDRVELRGIIYEEPYHLVHALSGDKPKGWVFGGAVQPLYTGPRDKMPDLARLSALTDLLKSLNVKKIESGKKAWDFVQSRLNDVNGSTADAALILFADFFRRMESEGSFYNQKIPLNQLKAAGFVMEEAEGAEFPVPDRNRMFTFFGGKVTPAMKNYLVQHNKDYDDPVWSDGGLIVALSEVAVRAIFWERFNKENPDFPLKEQTRHSEQYLRHSLTCGSDNSPVFDGSSNKVMPEFREVWETIARQYPGTKLAAEAATIAEMSRAAGWKKTKAIEAWMNKTVTAEE